MHNDMANGGGGAAILHKVIKGVPSDRVTCEQRGEGSKKKLMWTPGARA